MANTINTSPLMTQVSADRHVLTVDSNTIISVTATNNTILDQVTIDNTLNTSAVYLKLYNSDAGSASTVGTTNPMWVFPCAASSTADFTLDPGFKFLAGIQATCLTDKGTAGTTVASNDVTIVLLTHT